MGRSGVGILNTILIGGRNFRGLAGGIFVHANFFLFLQKNFPPTLTLLVRHHSQNSFDTKSFTSVCCVQSRSHHQNLFSSHWPFGMVRGIRVNVNELAHRWHEFFPPNLVLFAKFSAATPNSTLAPVVSSYKKFFRIFKDEKILNSAPNRESQSTNSSPEKSILRRAYQFSLWGWNSWKLSTSFLSWAKIFPDAGWPDRVHIKPKIFETIEPTKFPCASAEILSSFDRLWHEIRFENPFRAPSRLTSLEEISAIRNHITWHPHRLSCDVTSWVGSEP